MMETNVKLSLPVLASLALLAGCVPPPTPAAYPVPPPLPAEVLPLPPVSETPLVWQPGDWAYLNGSYAYNPGAYVSAVGHSRNWEFAHWAPGPGGPMFVPGHWQ
jgi:hypothetical protein